MTLHTDLTALFAAAGLDTDIEEAVADEHVRAAAYLAAISTLVTGETSDRALAAVLLRDPEPLTAKSAVVALIDTAAAALTDPVRFEQWATDLSPELDALTSSKQRAFVDQRIHDWTVHRRINSGEVPSDLTTVSDWMQRILAAESTAPAVLALLAETGNTKKIRNVARARANSL